MFDEVKDENMLAPFYGSKCSHDVILRKYYPI